MIYRNIRAFMEWFINQFIIIMTDIWNKLDNIGLTENISLLNLIITIIILEIFLGIVLTAPNRIKLKKEKRVRNDK